MAITVGSSFGASSSTAATSGTVASVTPDAGVDKRVIVVAQWGATTAQTIDLTGATFGGNAMTDITGNVRKTTDPSACVRAWEYKVGSSTTAQDVVVTSDNSQRWIVQAFILIGVPDAATPILATPEIDGDGTISAAFASAGIFIDATAVNTDDSSNTDNVLTPDGAQTTIRSSVSGTGGTAERRICTSYKTVTAGSPTLTTARTFTGDTEIQAAFGYYDSVGGGFEPQWAHGSNSVIVAGW